MKKRILSFALCAALCLGLCVGFAVPATAALQVEPMEYSIETSILVGDGADVFLLYDNGELWSYLFYRHERSDGKNLNEYVSCFMLNGVKAISSISASVSAASDSTFLALKYDGTLWFCEADIKSDDIEIINSVEQIDSNVARIYQNSYIKDNGEFYNVSRSTAGQDDGMPVPAHLSGKLVIKKDLVATNVIDVGRGFHILSNGDVSVAQHTSGNYIKAFSNGMLGFALNDKGELYGWGVHTFGGVGIGQTYDRYYFHTVASLFIEKDLRFIMNDVVNIYIDDNAVYARDSNGNLWIWGDAPTAPTLSNRAIQYNSPSLHYSPRKSDLREPVYTSIKGVKIKADGTLWTVINSHLTDNVEIKLPAKVENNKIVSINGTTTPPEAPSSWAVDAIRAGIEAEILHPRFLSKYQNPITRAEFAALAVALYENIKGEITGRSTFTDTNDVNVQKAAAIGVVSGVGDNKFAPNDKLTREQAAVMLARLANAIGKPLPIKAATFADNTKISSWAVEQVGQIQAAGIMGGVGNNTFAPKDPYTREQSIVTIMRLFDAVK